MGTNIISLSMDKDLEEEMTEYCLKNKISKSEFVSNIVREKLRKEKK